MKLPAASMGGGMAAAEAMARRRSVREFADRTLAIGQIAQLCWAGQGISESRGMLRTAPSAGAIYPVTLLPATRDGVFEYEPVGHSLRILGKEDIRHRLQTAALGQTCVGGAPMVMGLAIDVAKMAARYGERAERYCLLEVGHVAQNVFLQATAIGLGGVAIGAFHDGDVDRLFRVARGLSVVYLLSIGYPKDT